MAAFPSPKAAPKSIPAACRRDTQNDRSLTNLDKSALKLHTGFRRIYATVLDRWPGIGSEAVLGGRFEPLDILNA